MVIRIVKNKLRFSLTLKNFSFQGMKTANGHPLLTFPDSRCCLSFENYQFLLDYLFQINREETDPLLADDKINNRLKWVVVVDRRQDRWSSVKTIFSFLVVSFCFKKF